MVIRKAHNLETPVRIRPPQHDESRNDRLKNLSFLDTIYLFAGVAQPRRPGGEIGGRGADCNVGFG